jgi:feruloyl esterase
MKQISHSVLLLFAVSVLVLSGCSGLETLSEAQLVCEALTKTPNLSITSAQLVEATETTPQYCYVKGVISPAIRYHLQLPLPVNWNGRFLNWGDGGKDGDLDFADHRVAEGYAVANSNTGHDNGSEPGASFGFNNRQAEIDFGYRAVHLTVNAAKAAIQAYYDEDPRYTYHEGCSKMVPSTA